MATVGISLNAVSPAIGGPGQRELFDAVVHSAAASQGPDPTRRGVVCNLVEVSTDAPRLAPPALG
jgi:hypothetical protein